MSQSETTSIRSLSERVTKGTTPTTLGREYTSHGVRFLKVETFADDGTYLRGREAFIDESTNQLLRRSQLAEGDILFSIAGALGRSTIVKRDWLPANTNQALAIIRPRKRGKLSIDPRYLLWALRSPEIERRITEINVQAAQANLSLEQVRDFEIPLIPLGEQAAVADVLEDTSRLIASLECLVAKKRAIKQGMIQELLTGRTRLPGFTGEWDTTLLGSILKVRNGRSQRDVEVVGGRYPILATGGEIGRTDTPIYSKPSVLIGRKGTIDRPQFREGPFWTVDTLFYTEIGPQADVRFVYYLCTTIDWMALNEATGVPSLTGTRIETVEVALPSREEQQAISAVLKDADAEIAALERRLKATHAIKQGMMQELLTGRTRLVPEEVSA